MITRRRGGTSAGGPVWTAPGVPILESHTMLENLGNFAARAESHGFPPVVD